MTTTDHKKKTDVLHSHLRVWGLGQTLANRKPERRCNKGIVPPARRNDKTENCLIGMPAMPDDKLWITCFLCVPYFTSYVYWNIYIYVHIYIQYLCHHNMSLSHVFEWNMLAWIQCHGVKGEVFKIFVGRTITLVKIL